MNMNIKNILTTLTLFVGLNVTASAIEPTIISGANKTFTVDLADWAAYNVDVEITDLWGSVLLHDNIAGATGKIYNLKNLENGLYVVAVSNPTKTIKTTLEITRKEIRVGTDEVIYRPTVNLAKEHFDVSVLTQGQSVTVSVFDAANNLYTKTYTKTSAVNERFSMRQLPAGTYFISVSKGTDNKTYTFVK